MASFSFLPKNEKFYRLLEQLSSLAHDCALHLKTFVESQDQARRDAASNSIDSCKANAKDSLGAVTAALCRSYITPFDREDIQALSEQLYKITKTMEKVRERMQLHGLSSHRDDFSRQTALIVQEAGTMDEIIGLLTKGRHGDIAQKVTLLQDIELKGDAVLAELLVSLFEQGHSTRDLILRKDIYDMLEKVIDRYRDAAGVALRIVLKHG